MNTRRKVHKLNRRNITRNVATRSIRRKRGKRTRKGGAATLAAAAFNSGSIINRPSGTMNSQHLSRSFYAAESGIDGMINYAEDVLICFGIYDDYKNCLPAVVKDGENIDPTRLRKVNTCMQKYLPEGGWIPNQYKPDFKTLASFYYGAKGNGDDFYKDIYNKLVTYINGLKEQEYEETPNKANIQYVASIGKKITDGYIDLTCIKTPSLASKDNSPDIFKLHIPEGFLDINFSKKFMPMDKLLIELLLFERIIKGFVLGIPAIGPDKIGFRGYPMEWKGAYSPMPMFLGTGTKYDKDSVDAFPSQMNYLTPLKTLYKEFINKLEEKCSSSDPLSRPLFLAKTLAFVAYLNPDPDTRKDFLTASGRLYAKLSEKGMITEDKVKKYDNFKPDFIKFFVPRAHTLTFLGLYTGLVKKPTPSANPTDPIQPVIGDSEKKKIERLIRNNVPVPNRQSTLKPGVNIDVIQQITALAKEKNPSISQKEIDELINKYKSS